MCSAGLTEIARVSSLLSGLLSAEQFAEFARFLTVRTYPPEALVIRKGATIDAMFVVGEGAIRMEVGRWISGVGICF